MLLNYCIITLEKGDDDDGNVTHHLSHVGFHHLPPVFRALTVSDMYLNLDPD
jgi:hypothetical protein